MNMDMEDGKYNLINPFYVNIYRPAHLINNGN